MMPRPMMFNVLEKFGVPGAVDAFVLLPEKHKFWQLLLGKIYINIRQP